MGERGEAERRPEEELEPWEKEVKDAIDKGEFEYALDLLDYIVDLANTIKGSPRMVIIGMGAKDIRTAISIGLDAIKTYHKALRWRDKVYEAMEIARRATRVVRRRG